MYLGLFFYKGILILDLHDKMINKLTNKSDKYYKMKLISISNKQTWAPVSLLQHLSSIMTFLYTSM